MTPSSVCIAIALYFLLLAAAFITPHLDTAAAHNVSLACIGFGLLFWIASWWLK